MDSIQIKTGVISLPIIRDGENFGNLVFNPSDITFAQKFYNAMGEADAEAKKYRKRAEEIDANAEKDKNGDFILSKDGVDFLADFCQSNYRIIDNVFGDGISQKLFGGVLSLDVFSQFFEQIEPAFKKARRAKIDKYLPPERVKRGKSKSQKPQSRKRRK